jgi:hypothetical protein
MPSVTCKYCRQRFTTVSWEEHATCPHCGEEITQDGVDDSMRSVARVSSLAEVGYFEDVLSAAGIDAQVHEHDDFNAVSGSWNRTYVVRVETSRADEAVQLLETALASTADPDEPVSTKEEGYSRFVAGGVFFLLLGGLMFLLLAAGGRHQRWPWEEEAFREDEPAAGHPPALWRALAEDDAPLTDARDGSHPRRRLYYDDHGDILMLEEDFNGDGRIDRTRGFRGAGIVIDRDW